MNRLSYTMMVLLGTILSSNMALAAPKKQGESVEWEKHPYDEQEYYKGIDD